MLWDNSHEEKLDPVMTGRIVEIQSQMHCFDYYFGIYVLQLLLNHSDNLSEALQNSEILACKVHLLAAFSIKILENMHNSDSCDSIWDLKKCNAASLDLPESTISRKGKKPAKYLGVQETLQYNDITKASLKYKQVYFNAVDTIIACIKEQFDQPGFKACQSLKKLLIDTTHELTK